jgi:hypothetical protein
LAELKQVRVLDPHLTKVSDAGLKELLRLKNLELVIVAATGVTAVGAAEIQRALPNCRVRR